MTDIVVQKNIGPLTSMRFDNDLGITSPYSINFLIGGTVFDVAIAGDGTVLTDETTEAGDLTTNDITLLPAVPVAGDTYYFGSSKQFTEMAIELSTSAATNTFTVTWQYWNGAWSTLSVTDNSTKFTAAAGIYHMYWTGPTDWNKTIVTDSTGTQHEYYFIRYIISGAGAVGAQPLGRQARYYSRKSDWKVNSLNLQFDAASTATIQSYLRSSAGRSYDYMIAQHILESNTSYLIEDTPDYKFRDYLSLTITETGGQHVYGTLTIEEVAPGDY